MVRDSFDLIGIKFCKKNGRCPQKFIVMVNFMKVRIVQTVRCLGPYLYTSVVQYGRRNLV